MADLEPAARTVSQPSWIRLAPRHAASCTVTLLVGSAGSPIILWYSIWTHGTRTVTDRQTDVQYIMLIFLCLFIMLFSTNFGLRLAATWILIRTAEYCCGSACDRSVLLCFVTTVCAVHSLWSSSGLWAATCSVSCCAVTLHTADTGHCQATLHRLTLTQCRSQVKCVHIFVSKRHDVTTHCVLRTARSDNFTADAPIKPARAVKWWRVAAGTHSTRANDSRDCPQPPQQTIACDADTALPYASHSVHLFSRHLSVGLVTAPSLNNCRTVPNTGTSMSLDGSESVVQGQYFHLTTIGCHFLSALYLVHVVRSADLTRTWRNCDGKWLTIFVAQNKAPVLGWMSKTECPLKVNWVRLGKYSGTWGECSD